MSSSSTLYRLQQIDTAISDINNRLIEIDAIINDTSEIELAKKAFEVAESEMLEKEKLLKAANQLTKKHKLKIEQTHAKLFGGKISNPKVLQELQEESAALKRYLDVLEDRELEAMMEVEDAVSHCNVEKTAWKSKSAERIEQNAIFAGEKNSLGSELERLNAGREVALRPIPQEDLALYNSIRKKRRGVAVCVITNDSCSTCGTLLTSSLLQKVRRSNELCRCGTCQRILYSA